jgi:hypothetical protein
MFYEPLSQDTLRPVIAALCACDPGKLDRIPERISVKPPGCPALAPHLDQGRTGTYQTVVARLLKPNTHEDQESLELRNNSYHTS